MVSIGSLSGGNILGFSKRNSFGNSSQGLNQNLILVALRVICWSCWSVVGSINSAFAEFAESANDLKVMWFRNICMSSRDSDFALVVWFDGPAVYSTSITSSSNPI